MIDSALRHIFQYMDGQRDEPHLTSACWNIMGAMWNEEKLPSMQDIPARLEMKDDAFWSECEQKDWELMDEAPEFSYKMVDRGSSKSMMQLKEIEELLKKGVKLEIGTAGTDERSESVSQSKMDEEKDMSGKTMRCFHCKLDHPLHQIMYKAANGRNMCRACYSKKVDDESERYLGLIPVTCVICKEDCYIGGARVNSDEYVCEDCKGTDEEELFPIDQHVGDRW